MLLLFLLLLIPDVYAADLAADYDSKLLKLQKISLQHLTRSKAELGRILGYRGKSDVELEFVSPELFDNKVGKGSWAHAVYFNNRVTIELRPQLYTSSTKLKKLIRHETLHAAVGELANNNCSAWFEEGLAQVFEGGGKSGFADAMREFLEKNKPIPLKQLTVNFAMLDKPLARVAYAQSFFAVQSIVRRFGFSGVRKYLHALGQGSSEADAFKSAFGMALPEFQEQLDSQLDTWLQSGGLLF